MKKLLGVQMKQKSFKNIALVAIFKWEMVKIPRKDKP